MLQVHRLVVVDDDRHVVGVVSLSDLLFFLVLQPANEARARKHSAGSALGTGAGSNSSGKSSPKTLLPQTLSSTSVSSSSSLSQQSSAPANSAPVSTITLLSQGHQPTAQSTSQQRPASPKLQPAYSPIHQSSAQRPKSSLDKGKLSPKQLSPRGTPGPTIGTYKSKSPTVDGHGAYPPSGPSPQHPFNRGPRTG